MSYSREAELRLNTTGLGLVSIAADAATQHIVVPARRAAPLLEFASNVHSQEGEDGVLQALFARLGVRHRYAVEFGAWDGLKFSNCADLFRTKGWSGCLIEGNAEKFRELQRNYASFPRVALLERMVSWSGTSALDELLSAVNAPAEFDLLSVDVDGNDFWIWLSLERFRPSVVVIEFNPTCPNDVLFVQRRAADVNHGCSLLALTLLGEHKGYSLVTATRWNAFMVRDDVLRASGLASADFREFYSPVTDGRIWHGYDGTIFTSGMDVLLWSGVGISQADLQVLPRALRVFSDRQG